MHCVAATAEESNARETEMERKIKNYIDDNVIPIKTCDLDISWIEKILLKIYIKYFQKSFKKKRS